MKKNRQISEFTSQSIEAILKLDCLLVKQSTFIGVYKSKM